ncbi:L-rhamnose/proton symporter RhaT [Bacteroidota bacterium]
MGSTNILMGMILAIIAGTFLGSFALPIKKIKIWQWENTWIMYTLWATIILPIILALFTIPNLGNVYASVSFTTILTVFLFGAGWGVANIGFGMGIKLVGLALGTAIILGMNNAIGSILPIILYHPDFVFEPAGMVITAAVIVMVIGIIFCSIAGARRDKALKAINESASIEKDLFLKGLILCIMAGVFGAMFNFALIAGKPLEEQAIINGATQINAANATWCISLSGGFVITLIYVIYLSRKNNSFGLFTSKGTKINWLYTSGMGIMWFGGVALFGMAVMNLGKLGPSLGWPVIQSMAVASGNVWGIVTGEWKGSGKKTLQIMLTGLLFLFIGIGLIGWSSTLK